MTPTTTDPHREDTPQGDQPHTDEGGFYRIPFAIFDKLRREQPTCFHSLLAVYLVLWRESFFKRSPTFTLADAIVADRAGASRRSVIDAKTLLKGMGLLGFETSKVGGRYAPTRWTLPAVRNDCSRTVRNGRGVIDCADSKSTPSHPKKRREYVQEKKSRACADSSPRAGGGGESAARDSSGRYRGMHPLVAEVLARATNREAGQ